jgi:hypothetical protein
MFCTLYVFFWVIPWHLNFICRRFGTLCLFHLYRQVGKYYLPMKMEQTECSKVSACKIQMPGNYPEENIQRVELCSRYVSAWCGEPLEGGGLDCAQCFYSTMGLRNTLLLWCWITHKIIWQPGHFKSVSWLLHWSGVGLFTEPLLDCVKHDLVGARGWKIPLQYFFYLRIVVFWLLSRRGPNKSRNMLTDYLGG